MAVDTLARRVTASHAGWPGPVLPDGTLTVDDRSSLAGVYYEVPFVAVIVIGQRVGGQQAKNRAGGVPSKNRKAR